MVDEGDPMAVECELDCIITSISSSDCKSMLIAFGGEVDSHYVDSLTLYDGW